MYLIVGIFFVLAGVIMLWQPHAIFEISQSLRSKDPGEPTKLYIISTRFGGVMVTIVGIAAIVGQFLI